MLRATRWAATPSRRSSSPPPARRRWASRSAAGSSTWRAVRRGRSRSLFRHSPRSAGRIVRPAPPDPDTPRREPGGALVTAHVLAARRSGGCPRIGPGEAPPVEDDRRAVLGLDGALDVRERVLDQHGSGGGWRPEPPGDAAFHRPFARRRRGLGAGRDARARPRATRRRPGRAAGTALVREAARRSAARQRDRHARRATRSTGPRRSTARAACTSS